MCTCKRSKHCGSCSCRGPEGPIGPTGPQGNIGPTGPSNPNDPVYYRSTQDDDQEGGTGSSLEKISLIGNTILDGYIPNTNFTQNFVNLSLDCNTSGIYRISLDIAIDIQGNDSTLEVYVLDGFIAKDNVRSVLSATGRNVHNINFITELKVGYKILVFETTSSGTPNLILGYQPNTSINIDKISEIP